VITCDKAADSNRQPFIPERARGSPVKDVKSYDFAESKSHHRTDALFRDNTVWMTQLREFLRHQYIGAIVIGLLAFQGIQSLISAVSTAVALLTSPQIRSVLGYERHAIPWDRLLPNFIQAALALALAYTMLRWLYGDKSTPVTEETAESVE
jgi:hypothetical protein